MKKYTLAFQSKRMARIEPDAPIRIGARNPDELTAVETGSNFILFDRQERTSLRLHLAGEIQRLKKGL